MPVTSNTGNGDPYEHVLNDLRHRRDEIETAIRAIEAVRGPVAGVGAAVQSGLALESVSGAHDFAHLSIAEAGKAVLTATGKPMRTAEIVPLIKAGGVKLGSVDPNNTVNSILSRRANSVGDIVRVGRSFWDLKDRVSPPAFAVNVTNEDDDLSDL